MKTYQGMGDTAPCDIHPSSTMHALMEAAERSRKPEDARKARDHYEDIHRAFLRQCGLTSDQLIGRWSIGSN